MCISCSCIVLTFDLATTRLSGVNGYEGLTVCSVVSVWDSFSKDPEGCVIKKESVVTEYLWSAKSHSVLNYDLPSLITLILIA